jgi:hypothetical protein
MIHKTLPRLSLCKHFLRSFYHGSRLFVSLPAFILLFFSCLYITFSFWLQASWSSQGSQDSLPFRTVYSLMTYAHSSSRLTIRILPFRNSIKHCLLEVSYLSKFWAGFLLFYLISPSFCYMHGYLPNWTFSYIIIIDVSVSSLQATFHIVNINFITIFKSASLIRRHYI